MSKQKRLIALLMCAGLLLFMLVSSAYIVHETTHHHECSGEDCPICALIAQVEQIRRDLGVVLLALVLLLFASAACYRWRREDGFALPVSCTPVSWKIRLNN